MRDGEWLGPDVECVWVHKMRTPTFVRLWYDLPEAESPISGFAEYR